MEIYVGYVIFDYEIPVVQSIDRYKVEEYLKENFQPCDRWYIEEYPITDDLIKFNCKHSWI